MNIQQLGPDRLRIQLDPKDLDQYDLDYYSINKDSQGTKRLVNAILSQARKNGFNTYHSKLVIEVLPGKNSGCILYITKSPFEKASNHSIESENNNMSQYSGYILSCDSLEDAIEAIEHFANYPDLPIQRSALYNYDGKYHLIFVPVLLGLNRNRLVSLLAALSEYGNAKSCTTVHEAMLAEHGNPIVKSRAVENFIRYFHEKKQ